MTVDAQDPIELRKGPLRLALRPDLGACISGLWREGRAVLRSTDDPLRLDTPRDSGGFVLLPYSNRLGWRRFRFGGREYATAQNVAGMPHALHGLGWQRAWTVQCAEGARAELRLQHRPDEDWPFALDAAQVITLDETGLGLTVSVTNLHADRAPVGLGWHPYFLRQPGSRLRARVRQRWLSDPLTALPTQCESQGPIDAEVQRLDLDHCLEGWAGPARIDDLHHAMELRSSLQRLVIYTPPGRDFFCVEPVSHVNNALNMAEPARCGIRILEPGQSFSAWVRLDIADAAARS